LGRTGGIIGAQDSGKLRCAARQAPQALLQVWRVNFECATAWGVVNAMPEGRYRLIGAIASPNAIVLILAQIQEELWKVDRRPSWGQRPTARVLPSKRSRAV
jgi:hypothetical protein